MVFADSVYFVVYAAGEKMSYSWLTPTQFAAREGACRKRVLEWMTDKRVEVWEPAQGDFLINAKCHRPEKRRPWHVARAERIERAEYSR